MSGIIPKKTQLRHALTANRDFGIGGIWRKPLKPLKPLIGFAKNGNLVLALAVKVQKIV
jgi:hypothetical protein